MIDKRYPALPREEEMALPARVVVAQQELGDVIEFANGLLGLATRANRRSGRKELPARRISLQRARIEAVQCRQQQGCASGVLTPPRFSGGAAAPWRPAAAPRSRRRHATTQPPVRCSQQRHAGSGVGGVRSRA